MLRFPDNVEAGCGLVWVDARSNDGEGFDTMTDYVQVSTAVADREAARTLARSVIAAGLAAGAQIVGPVASVVWHLGELAEGEEPPGSEPGA